MLASEQRRCPFSHLFCPTGGQVDDAVTLAAEAGKQAVPVDTAQCRPAARSKVAVDAPNERRPVDRGLDVAFHGYAAVSVLRVVGWNVGPCRLKADAGCRSASEKGRCLRCNAECPP